MQSVAVFVALLAAVSATNYQYVLPQYNQAVVTSQRVGGNFAYSVQQPGVQQVYTTGYPTVGATQVVAKNVAGVPYTVPAATAYKTVAGVPTIASPYYGYNNLGYTGYNGVYPSALGYNGVYPSAYSGLGYNGVYPTYGQYNGLGNVVVA